MTTRCPGCSDDTEVSPFACMIAADGTPYRRDSVSTVSPGATVTAVPPSQSQLCRAAAGAGLTAPVISDDTGAGAGLYEAMPVEPIAVPGGSDNADCRPGGGGSG